MADDSKEIPREEDHEERARGHPRLRSARRVIRETFARFGKGRHRAALNFGDCMSYAVARLAGQPLLCTGADFAKTDLTLA